MHYCARASSVPTKSRTMLALPVSKSELCIKRNTFLVYRGGEGKNGRLTEEVDEKPEKHGILCHELFKMILKFDPKNDDISLCLSIFERQAKRVEVDAKDWASELSTVLHTDLVQSIARELEENFDNYTHILKNRQAEKLDGYDSVRNGRRSSNITNDREKRENKRGQLPFRTQRKCIKSVLKPAKHRHQQ
ncbi:uncharacterized protein NPIL_92291 [Nephila pilipes]|uniref:Uncharacterized protein n=1 Tax=Nephila pilipes TaxID=299642 RepID=A0A8X6P7Y8_NEPPI|nr:uncharacterized protein NPIL_92291 [Nephila pilipes]